ncbi:MAG: YfhO family protein [Candidatus Solibacter sp.]|nr:YfhO family protein [Candidatus Solibacter sp.]
MWLPFGRRDAVALAVVAACVVVAFWKIALTSQFTFIEAPDIGHQVLPWLQVQSAALHKGLAPLLWDPYIGGGQPLAGQLQPAVFSPLTWILLATPTDPSGHLRLEWIHWWFVLLHILAGWFAYAFLRSLEASRGGSTAGAVFFAAAGFVGTTNWPQIVAGAIWLPLVFLFHMRSLRGGRPITDAVLAGGCLALSLLGGHHAVPAFAVLAILALGCAAAVLGQLSWRAAACRTVILYLVAGCGAAVQLLPAVEYARYSVRWVNSANPMAWHSTVPYTVHLNLGWSPAELIFLAVPGSNETIVNPIVGVVPLALAAAALLAVPRRRAAARLAGLALGAALFSLARFNPFHGVLYALLPGLEKARAPIMAMAIAHVALAALAALGMDALLARAVPGLRRLRAGLALGAGLLFLLALYPPPVLRGIPHASGRAGMIAVVAVLLWALLAAWDAKRVRPALLLCGVLALALIEIGNSTGFDYVHVEDKASLARPRLYQTTAGLATFLKSRAGSDRVSYVYDDLVFNFGDWHGIPSLAGFLPSAPEATWRLGPWNPRILDLYSVRYWIGGQKPADAGPQVYADAEGWRVWQRQTALPRAWMAHQVKVAHSQEEAVRLTLDPATDLRSTVVLDRSIGTESCAEAGSVVFTAIDEQHLRLDATPACAGVLVLSDNWYPGWQATLDGKTIEVLRADAAIRAVAVPAGPHRIEMRYAPSGMGWAAALSLATLAGILLAAIWAAVPV